MFEISSDDVVEYGVVLYDDLEKVWWFCWVRWSVLKNVGVELVVIQVLDIEFFRMLCIGFGFVLVV